MIMAERTIKEWCRLMPKVEVHRHFEGSLRPELIFPMAQRHGIAHCCTGRPSRQWSCLAPTDSNSAPA